MDNKETKVAIIGIIATAILMFFAGMLYEKTNTSEFLLKNVCTPDKLCPNAQEAIKRLRSYQLETYSDSTIIWDGDRHVSTLLYDSTSALDKVIMADNE